jgi:hypothetical protein
MVPSPTFFDAMFWRASAASRPSGAVLHLAVAWSYSSALTAPFAFSPS